MNSNYIYNFTIELSCNKKLTSKQIDKIADYYFNIISETSIKLPKILNNSEWTLEWDDNQ